jgi:chromosome segregation ATPase
MFEMISVSCDYKKRINGVETDLEALKRDLQTIKAKWEELRPKLVVAEPVVKKAPKYKAVKGDEVD